MSKKHRHNELGHYSAGTDHAAEYKIIKHDLIKVVMLNVIYLAGILLIYFTNSKTHYLENWFGRILHF